MFEHLQRMLSRYQCVTGEDYKNALKEIIQEIALFGLWRSKFFEHAAFYGGTALRILYGLDRFSEDLDFSLLKQNLNFDLSAYEAALKREIESFGLVAEIQQKVKNHATTIQSAFIKANTRLHLIKIGAPMQLQKLCQSEELVKVKLEVETDPPDVFQTETKVLMHPLPFSIRCYALPYLFAGKLHALLWRQWGKRVKGRDWYDLVWFIAKKVPVNLNFLERKMRQTGVWTVDQAISRLKLMDFLQERIINLDIESARNDVIPFVSDPRSIEAWSHDFFLAAIKDLTVQ